MTKNQKKEKPLKQALKIKGVLDKLKDQVKIDSEYSDCESISEEEYSDNQSFTEYSEENSDY